MIDIPEEDVVACRRTADGRFVLFTRTDRPRCWPLPWYGVQLDTGGDAVGILAGLDPGAGVLGLQDLLHVAHARALVEQVHDPEALRGAARRLRHAVRCCGSGQGRVRFLPPPSAGAPWTVAALGDHHLPFRPPAEVQDDAVTLPQVLVVLDQLLADAAVPAHRRPLFRLLQADVRAALAAVDRP